MSAPDYLAGVAELALAVAALGAGAARARGLLLPGWTGPPARLAEAVLVLGLLVTTGELLGTFGAFAEGPYFAACIAVGIGLRVLLPGAAGPPRGEAPPAPAVPPTALVVAAFAVGLLVAHWSIGTRLHLDQGMTGFDTTWYHGPLAALFAGSGSTGELHFIAPDFLAWFYPLNSELLHAVGILATGRDIASPVLNIGWLGGCLLAAWCVGRPYGAGPWSLLAVAALLDSGVLADQAGEARNDIVGIFFVLAAAAVLVNAAAAGNDRLPRGALAVAGLAAGLAAGTKLNFLPIAAALLVGCVVLAAPAARTRAALWFGGPMLAGGGYWYLRNLLAAGNPLPWAKSLGPISLPAPSQELGGREQHSVADYLDDGSIWADWFLPGLHDGLGLLWPALLALALGPLLIGLGRRAGGPVRVLAAAGLVGALAWVVEPSSAAGPEGTPVAFVSNLRHLAPALALGLALLPALAGVRVSALRAGGLLAALLALLAFADASGEPWLSDYRWGALGLGAAVALAVIAASSAAWARLDRTARALIAVAILGMAIGAGYAVQRDYLRDRYAHPDFATPGLDGAFAWARDLRNARIATTSTRQYPLFGTDLSNDVRYLGERRSHGGFVDIRSCRAWRRALNDGGFDYVVASRDRIEPGRAPFPAQARWTADRAAELVLRRPPTVLYRLSGELDPGGCGR